MRPIALSLVVVLAAGCAELRWSKSGTDSAKLEQDLTQCRGEARIQASRVSLPRAAGMPPTVGTDPMGRPVPAQSRSRTDDPMLLEQDLASACMRGKGYELAPVAQQ